MLVVNRIWGGGAGGKNPYYSSPRVEGLAIGNVERVGFEGWGREHLAFQAEGTLSSKDIGEIERVSWAGA